ncbi:hypothetical protein LDENG_00131890 [Lucifuga dentata]|nr:hypothetical protein LDENG_00131890 [Lucifuga dentata]
MDDLLIWGTLQEEHNTRLHVVLQKIQNAGITLNAEKCELSRSEVSFLGHIVSAEQIKPDPGKTEAVLKMLPPSNISDVRSFLGMVKLGKC